jgi:C4-dicarboxylate transporter DctM subunit
MKVTWKQLSKAFFRALPAIFMPMIVLGGIYGGVFTPTEAGNVAVVYGFIVGFFIYKELTLKMIPKLLKQTAINTAAILFIVGAANAFGNVMAREGLPQKMAEIIISASGSKIMFLLLINILFLILGTFVEANSAAILFAPILMPVARYYEIDPVFFGVILVVNLAIGLITPPLGVNLYVAAGIINDKVNVVLNKYFIGYLSVSVSLLFLFTYVPDFTMSLFRALKGL